MKNIFSQIKTRMNKSNVSFRLILWVGGLKLILVVLSIFLFTGCNGFLDIRPEATVPSSGMDYTKPENIFLPISAAYASMRTGGTHSFSYVGAFEIASDNADKGSSPEDNPTMKQIDNFTFDASNTLINELWGG